MQRPGEEEIRAQRVSRAMLIQKSGGLQSARESGLLNRRINITLSEALVLGLIEQDVKIFYTVFGHGSTEIGEVLRIYQDAGLVKVFGLRSEIEASHAAMALRWVTGEKAAVVTSIGPGALQAMAASIAPTSDGIGVWYLFGDETTQDEGYNMQQITKHEQGNFEKLMSAMGRAYTLHTPLAVSSALQAGAASVDHPFRQRPFYLLMPMNMQSSWMENFNLDELPKVTPVNLPAAAGDYPAAAKSIRSAKRILVKAGGGAIHAGAELEKLLELTRGVLVHTPIATGCIPYSNPGNMGVGGSKGSICGNHAMENADLLIAIGTRAVCQSDCSRTGYPNVRQVININADPEDALHYHHTLPLVGDVKMTLRQLNEVLEKEPHGKPDDSWLQACGKRKNEWQRFKETHKNAPVLFDDYWQRDVLTQPAVVMTALDWAKANHVIAIFDAGDVQANGFQITEDERPGLTLTETGASYMGFAVSALLATGTASKPFYGMAFSGDGSFTMNPQVLIDGAEYGARGCILLLDNGRMAAISGLQDAQYAHEFATFNRLKVDYLIWARAVPGVKALDGGSSLQQLKMALDEARQHNGLSLIHVPVYYGDNELGGMGVYGCWNVGNWCDNVQELRHEIGL